MPTPGEHSEFNRKRIAWLITIGALLCALVHFFRPHLPVDATTIILLILSIVPWLAPLVKSFELPGGFKVEFQDKLQEIASRAESAGLLADASTEVKQTPPYQTLAEIDPNLALAGLRIEIEKRLTTLASSLGVADQKYGIGRLLQILVQLKIFTVQEFRVIRDLVGILNQAVHGATLDVRATAWAMDEGQKFLASLDQRINEERLPVADDELKKINRPLRTKEYGDTL